MEKIIDASNVTVAYNVSQYKVTSFKEFLLRRLKGLRDTEKFRALNSVSVHVNKGECVAFVGHNGSGKSTLLKVIAGIIEPPGARVIVKGRIAPMIELGAGFDGELSGRANIRLSCMLMGLSAREVEERMDHIIQFSEIGEHIDLPLKNYSSGMQARLGFACATSVDPDVLLVDEVLSVGDSNFARKCLKRIEELRKKGTTAVLVSHDEGTVRRFCSRAYVLNAGQIVAEGDTEDALKAHRDIMNEKYLVSLTEADRQAFLRKQALEDADRDLAWKSAHEKPTAETSVVFQQAGLATNNLDFGRPFQAVVRFTVSNTHLLQGELSIGLGFHLSGGRRLGGACSLAHGLKLPHPSEGETLHLVLEFGSGLPLLSAQNLEVVYGVFDQSLKRTLSYGHATILTGENSVLGLNVDGDVLNMQGFLTSVQVQ